MLLSDLTIENFRSFDQYRLDGLARVNLLVGDNNCGKTSVLEAARILVSSGKIAAIFEQLEYREDISRTSRADGRYVTTTLFNQSSPTVDLNEFRSVRLAADSHDRQVEINYQFRPDEADYSLVSVAKGLDGSVIREEWVPVDEDGREMGRPRVRDGLFGPAIPPHIYVPSNGIDTALLARVWKSLLPHKREVYAEDALRLILPDTQQIVFVPETETRRDILVDDGTSNRTPIAQQGGGAYQLVSLGVSLAYAEQGFLLVDEIDAGIHYSRLADVWQLVIQTAKKLDVQVFATTHSLDCIRGLSEAVNSEAGFVNEVAIFRVDRSVDRAVRFDGEEIPVVVDSEIEVR